jgi:hypothetical protein
LVVEISHPKILSIDKFIEADFHVAGDRLDLPGAFLDNIGKERLERFSDQEAFSHAIIESNIVWNRRFDRRGHEIEQIGRLLQLHRPVSVLLNNKEALVQFVAAPVAYSG